MVQKTFKMTETLANRYSSESTPRELSNEYQHDRVKMLLENLFVLVLCMKVLSALKGLKSYVQLSDHVSTSPANVLNNLVCILKNQLLQ